MVLGSGYEFTTDLEAKKIGNDAMPLYVFRFHADHCITSETPTQWDIENRISAHLMVLDVGLLSYLTSGTDEDDLTNL